MLDVIQSSQLVTKQRQFEKKIMIRTWRNFDQVIHFEIIPHRRLVNSKLYCEHLGRMYTFWKTKGSALINRMTTLLLQDNAKSNASYMIRNKVEKN